MSQEFLKPYDFTGQSFLITGGAGVLGKEMARALYACGANIAVLHYKQQKAQQAADDIREGAGSGSVIGVEGDVLKRDTMQLAIEQVIAEYGQVDGLINAAGGNKPGATTNTEKAFFDLPQDALQWVFDLNLMGTIIPSQVVGRHMAERKQGVILNVSSMSAFRPLTRVLAYGAAKAAASNFTQWLAVYMAQEYAPEIRVNAVAPGFFLTDQNRFLLTDPQTGELSARGQKIIDHTPMGRFGSPADLNGTVLWLLSPASAFITGIIVPVDGGFSAYSGV